MEKIKCFINLFLQILQSDKAKDFLTIFVIILVGLGSFGLGRLSKKDIILEGLPAQAGLKIEYKGQEASVFGIMTNDSNSNSKNFFASNRGSKYYSLGCSGGKAIKQENRIYFDTKKEAENAGYELSSSCK